MRPGALAMMLSALLAVGALASCSDSGPDAGAVEPSEPASASRSRQGATVWAVGDGADGRATGRAVARLIARDRPTRFLYLGDVYEHGSASEFARNYRPTFGRLARITSPTPGNHDWGAYAKGYEPYWRGASGMAVKTYYSLKTGGWQIISLNSEQPHGEGSAQVRWLRSRLRGRSTCRLAFWHRPLQSAGMHGDQEDVEPLWNALRGRATIVVNGHDHDMQRFEPRQGITQFVSGAGGHGLYKVDADPRLAFSNDSEYGALRLRLRRGLARYSFVSVSGETLDRGLIRCRR